MQDMSGVAAQVARVLRESLSPDHDLGESSATELASLLTELLGARSFHLGRFDSDTHCTHIVLNCGRTPRWQSMRPRDESYGLDDHPFLEEPLLHGRSWSGGVKDDRLGPAERAYLASLEAPYAAAVTMASGTRPWGHVLLTRRERPFTADEVALAEVLVAAMATRLAREYDASGSFAGATCGGDELTGLSSAAAFHSRLVSLLQGPLSRQPVHVVVADIQGIRRVDDERGQQVSDDVVRQVGELLTSRTASWDGALLASLDRCEFGIVVGGPSPDWLPARVVELREAARDLDASVHLRWGFITLTAPPIDPKRHQEAALAVMRLVRASREREPLRARTPLSLVPSATDSPTPEDLVRTVAEVLFELDAMPSQRMSDRLALVAERCSSVINGGAWRVGRLDGDSAHGVRWGISRRPSTEATGTGGMVEPLPVQYPATVRDCEAFALHADLAEGDVGIRMHLASSGYQGLFACGGYDPDARQWVVEIVTDSQSSPTPWLTPVLGSLVAAATGFPRGVEVPLPGEETPVVAGVSALTD